MKSNKFIIKFSNRDIDLSLRREVVKEMKSHESVYMPDNHWIQAEKQLLKFLQSKDDFFKNNQFEDKYRIWKDTRQIEDFDYLNIHKNYINYSLTPFSRAIDHLNKIVVVHRLLHRYTLDKKITVIEVGGGYGRTALFFLNYFGPKICYVNVDAVPAALIISKQFLQKNCRKDIRIAGVNDVDGLRERKTGKKATETYNYISFPAWRISELPNRAFDIALNIWSMQEMSEHHELLYYRLWERVCKHDSILFFLNRNKRKFASGYKFSNRWIHLYEGHEATYGDPERIFILNSSFTMRKKLGVSLLRMLFNDKIGFNDYLFKGRFQTLITALSK